MSRGLGRQQRDVLDALRQLARERGPGWRTPAEVVAVLLAARPAAAGAVSLNPLARLEAAQLAQCRALVGMGHWEFAAQVAVLEARAAQRGGFLHPLKGERAANQKRPDPRGGEDMNPSRVLASLARRGLVKRIARPGPGAMVRLAARQV